ncbi:hypothetical protein V0U79_10765 [Hyphobacterium sp. HN65]|uniref:DUF4386 domain-containing protein n=1 Tax=Hyphobacterium lacteum TaxID=3116575 RepID=A0ABU7LSH8_9PROT|nr:hypothetical protein [Hyphobacterium sp. HN65]MEE2526853.1 hypothetical protein [Hyphobacterium sp. HN65]
MIKRTIVFTLKSAALWIVILMSSAAAAALLGMGSEVVNDNGPLGAGSAFLVVNGLHALVLAAIGARAAVRGWKLGALLGATLYLAQSFLLIIEAFYFASSVDTPAGQLIDSSLLSLAAAVGVGIAATFLWKPPEPDRHPGRGVRALVIPLSSVALLYPVFYFTAGFFIAWSVPEVRDFYGDGLDINIMNLLAFQVFRGMIWALLAQALVRNMKRGTLAAATIVGASFSILASAQLLYPNAFMPWEVRLPHLVEIGISNFVFGVIAGLVLGRKN